MERVRMHFKPEFLNRLDEIVMFNSLGLKQLRTVVNMNLKLIETRLSDRDITIEMDGSAIDFVLRESYDPAYGARPIRRYLERELVTKISRGVFTRDIPNHSNVEVTYDGKMDMLKLNAVSTAKDGFESDASYMSED